MPEKLVSLDDVRDKLLGSIYEAEAWISNMKAAVALLERVGEPEDDGKDVDKGEG